MTPTEFVRQQEVFSPKYHDVLDSFMAPVGEACEESSLEQQEEEEEGGGEGDEGSGGELNGNGDRDT